MASIQCELVECKTRCKSQMGHRRCAHHCECLSTLFLYDPSRCDHCRTFFLEHFVAPPTVDLIASGISELNCHIKKLARHANRLGHSLSSPPYIRDIKNAARLPVDTNYFVNFTLPDSFDSDLVVLDSDESSSKLSSVSQSSSIRDSLASCNYSNRNSIYWKTNDSS